MQPALFLTVALFAFQPLARDIPSYVQTFYDNVVAQGACHSAAATGFYSIQGDSKDYSYCKDHLDDYGVVYIQGRGGRLSNMDIDCDGIQGSPADDNRCKNSGDTQSQTSFKDTVASYNRGTDDLDANIHSYVVFGNVGSAAGYKTFNPASLGIEPLSLMAVVCNNKLLYGVWGDENGDDGPPLVGEASISLATLCFGTGVNGDNGYDGTDVLYLAFPGVEAVPGPDGADWGASNRDDFQASLQDLGNQLIQRLSGTGSGGGGGGGGGGSCSWPGHCAGASCGDENDCSDDLVCKSGVCAAE